MSNYRYAIKKLNTKSWIKYWLWRNRTGGTKYKFSLSELMENSEFHLQNTIKRNIDLNSLIGSSWQDEQPTQETSQQIHNSGESGAINIDFVNKNLFDGKNPTASNYATTTLEDDITTVSSTATDTLPSARWIFEDLNENDVIRFEGIVLDTNGSVVLQAYINDWLSIVTRQYISSQTVQNINYTVPNNVTKVRLLLYSNKEIPSGPTLSRYKNIIVTKNNSNMNYISHAEQNISFPMAQGQKLYEGEELKENGKDDMWKELVLDGETTGRRFTSLSDYLGLYYFIIAGVTPAGINGANNVMSTHFIAREYTSNCIYITGYGTTIVFVMSDQTIDTVQKANEWLSEQYTNGTPVKVLYKKANPTITPFTPEQELAWEEMKKLYTYSDETNITISERAKLKFKYWERIER